MSNTIFCIVVCDYDLVCLHTVSGSRVKMVIPCFKRALYCLCCLHDWISESGKVSEKMKVTFEPSESHRPRPTGGMYVRAGSDSEESALSVLYCSNTVCLE